MTSENSTPPATDEIRLLLIGPPKTGQSSIANILAGCNVFPVGASSSVNSATPTTQSRHYTNKKILVGKHLLVVDAPPLFILKDSTSNEQDMRRLAKCVALVSPGPHAIFLILSCDDAKNERFDMKQIVTTVFGAEALDQSIVVFSFIDRLERKGVSVDDWINKECKQQALLEARGHRYLVIDSSHNDQSKHIDFLNRSLTMLNELWKRERIFKSKMFDDIEQEIQRQEKNRWDLFQKKYTNNFHGSEKAFRILLREHMRDELEREPILAEADYLVVEKYLQPILKSLLQEAARYLEEEIVGHLKSTDIPIWYSIYKRFPPIREPRYLSLTEGDIPKAYEPPKLLYDEDIIRQAYYEDIDDGEIIKLKNNDRKSRSQVFIDEYFKLKSKQKNFISHSKLFRLTLEYLQQHGHPIMFKIDAEQKYPEISSQLNETITSSINDNNQSNISLDTFETEWERNNKEGYFPLSKNTYQYHRLQPHRVHTSFGEETRSDSGVVHRRTDGYVHSTVRGDEVKQIENTYMPGENLQPLVPPTFIQQNMLRHGKVHNVFTREQYEQDPFLRLQDRVKNLQYYKKPPIHDKVFKRKFKAKKFLVDIPGIYDKK